MISTQRSGPPSTQNVAADSEGVCVRLPTWSTSLHVRTRSPIRLYWTQADFDADKNGLDVSGEDEDTDLRLNASVANIWLRGLGGSTNVAITSIGIG